jgi:hypothetical protein
LEEHGWWWVQARKPKIVEGKPKIDQPETEAMAAKMLELAELQKQGKFEGNREEDVLNVAIGSKEHGGRVRDVSSQLTIKDGFQNDRARYRSHERYTKSLRICSWQHLRSSSSRGYFGSTHRKRWGNNRWSCPH